MRYYTSESADGGFTLCETLTGAVIDVFTTSEGVDTAWQLRERDAQAELDALELAFAASPQGDLALD